MDNLVRYDCTSEPLKFLFFLILWDFLYVTSPQKVKVSYTSYCVNITD